MTRILFITGLLFISSFCWANIAQDSNNVTLEIQDIKVQENVFTSKYKGIRLTFEVKAKTGEDDKFISATFFPSLSMQEKEIPLYLDVEKNTILRYNDEEQIHSNASVSIFIPYIAIDLPAGKHKLQVKIHSNFEGTKIENIASIEQNFIIPEIKKHSYTEQEFDIKNIKPNFNASREDSKGIEIQFDCYFKYGYDQVINTKFDEESSTYCFFCRLKDSSGNIVYSQGQANQGLFCAGPGYIENDNKPVAENIKLFIPYYKINKKGPFVADLEILASKKDGSHVFKPLKKQKIEIFKPVTYNYEEQDFNITHCIIDDQYENYGQNGIYANIRLKFKFGAGQIAGADTNQNLKNYYFYLTITDTNGFLVYSPSITEVFTGGNETANMLKMLKATNSNYENELNFFIPYRLLSLQNGRQMLDFQLHATNKENTIHFRNLYSKYIRVQQPVIDHYYIRVDNLEVEKGTYDVAGKDIPLVNLFISPKSKTGKGYPDVCWSLRIGDQGIFRSDVSKNSFYGNDGYHQFRKAKIDSAYFYVYDMDITTFNDNIGNFMLTGFDSITEKYYENLSFEKVKNVNLKINKLKLPSIHIYDYSLDTMKLNGVSGLRTQVNLKADFWGYESEFLAQPLLMDHFNSADDFTYKFLLDDSVLERVGHFSYNNNYKDTAFSHFIPFYSINENTALSTFFSYPGSDIPFYTLTDLLEKEYNNADDIQFHAKIKENYQYEDFKGIRIDIDQKIPSEYLENFKKDDILNSYGFYNKKNNVGLIEHLQEINEFGIDKDKVEAVNFPILENKLNKSYFIPYYKLFPLKGEQKLRIEQKTWVNSTGFVIGENQKVFDYQVPRIYRLQIQKYDIRIRHRRRYKYLFWEVYHGDNLVYKTPNLENNSKTLHWEKLPANKIYCHSQDKINMYFFGINRKGEEKLLKIWSFNAGEFYRNQDVMQLNRNKAIKEGSIQFFIQ